MAEEAINVVETPAEKTYTQSELESYVSKAINDYSKKLKDKVAKTTDERVAELEREIARRDNLEAVRSAMKEAAIPDTLEALFTGDNYEDKIKQFTDWQTSMVEETQKSLISGVQPIHLNNSDVQSRPTRRSLSDIEQSIK